MGTLRPPSPEELPGEDVVVEFDGDGQAVLDALQDRTSRAILEATDGRPATAHELSEALDVPLSTTYRKLGTLVETGLLVELTRVGSSGKHSSEYARAIEEVVVDFEADGGHVLRISMRDLGERLRTPGQTTEGRA